MEGLVTMDISITDCSADCEYASNSSLSFYNHMTVLLNIGDNELLVSTSATWIFIAWHV